MIKLIKWIFIFAAVLVVIQHFNAEDEVGKAVTDTSKFVNEQVSEYLPKSAPSAP
jgi:hypothetical protein